MCQCCTAYGCASHWEWKSSGGTGSSVTENTSTALYPQDSCLHDFPLLPGGFSLHSENRIYGPMHVRKDDKQLATVCAPKVKLPNFPEQFSLESKHQTSPKGTPMPRNRALDPTGRKHPRWCRNALHGSQEPDSYLFAHVRQALATQLHRNQQECLQTKVLHSRGEDHNLTFWSLSYCRTGPFRDCNLLAKPEAPHNPSGLNKLAKLPCQIRSCLPSAVTAPGSSSQENSWGSQPQPEALLPPSCCSISSEGTCDPETGRISPTNNRAHRSSPTWQLRHTASLTDPEFG